MANEMRLIDANALLEKIGEEYDLNYGEILTDPKRFAEMVEDATTVDAVEVVHGRWIVLAEFLDRTICTQCSVCGEEYTYKNGKFEFINFEYAKYNYCPNCGAKMDGERKNDD